MLINRKKENGFAKRIRLELKKGYGAYECTMSEIVHTMLDIVSFDTPAASGTVFIEWLSRFSKRYGFDFGFKDIDDDKDYLAQFYNILSNTEDIRGVLVRCYTIIIYFRYMPFIQVYKDLYARAEVFTEEIWTDIDRQGFCIVDTREFMNILGDFFETVLSRQGWRMTEIDNDTCKISVDKKLDS